MQTALDFDSSATTGGNRSDERFEGEFQLSKSFPIRGNQSLKPHLSYHFIRNASNAPYYDFDKYSVEIGLEYDF